MISKNVLRFVLSLKIKQLRKEKKYSLKDLAEISGLSHSYLNEIEKGKKYPKVDKLTAIAKALNVPYEDLVSAKMGTNLHPLLKYLESEMAKDLPLDAFGISEHDVYQLMSHAPEKFSSFLMTILELARAYDFKIDDLNNAALRSYQEINNNYFQFLEKKATSTRKNFNLDLSVPISTAWLKEILIKEYNYQIDEETLTQREETKDIRSVLKNNRKKVLYINSNLNEPQKSFIFARELGRCLLNLNLKKDTTYGTSTPKFLEILNDFHASYFSGAFLINEKEFAQDIISFFKRPIFDQNIFLKLIDKYNISIEVFMHRVAQILPTYIKSSQIFFLRSNEDYKISPKQYYISKELHLGRLHNPHGVALNEHYCRRWITTWLIEKLSMQIKKYNNEDNIIQCQISNQIGSNLDYFCISVARKSNTKDGTLSCLTIGFLMNEDFQESCSIWKDAKIPRQIVGQTCERCPSTDCVERVSEPILLNAQIQKEKKRLAIAELKNSTSKKI